MRRHLFGLRDSRLQILVRDVLEPHFAGSADVQRKRTVRAVLGLGNGIADAAGVVQEGTEDVGIEHELDGVPLARSQAGVRPRNGRRDAAGKRGKRWWPSCARGRWRLPAMDSAAAAPRATVRRPALSAALWMSARPDGRASRDTRQDRLRSATRRRPSDRRRQSARRAASRRSGSPRRIGTTRRRRRPDRACPPAAIRRPRLSGVPMISPFSARQVLCPIGCHPVRLEPVNTASGAKFFDAPWMMDANAAATSDSRRERRSESIPHNTSSSSGAG